MLHKRRDLKNTWHASNLYKSKRKIQKTHKAKNESQSKGEKEREEKKKEKTQNI